MERALGNEHDARHDERVVPRQDIADRRIGPGANDGVGAQQVVADEAFPRRDALHHDARRGMEECAGIEHGLGEIPETGIRHAVLRGEQEADADLLDVVGRHLSLEAPRLVPQKLRERRVRLRHVGRREQPPVVHEHDRLERGAEGLVPPDRPARQLGGLRGLVGLRVPVVHELHLHIHRRAPQHVGAAARLRGFADEPLVDLDAFHLLVIDLDPRVHGAEFLEQRGSGGKVRRRIDHKPAFTIRRRDGFDVTRGITRGNLRGRGERDAGQKNGEQAFHEVILVRKLARPRVLPAPCGGRGDSSVLS